MSGRTDGQTTPAGTGGHRRGRDPGTTEARIAALLRDVPRPGEDAATRAEWFDRKADLFTDIAETGGPTAADAGDAAHQARVEARRLRGGEPR
jgi:hypothetical protein